MNATDEKPRRMCHLTLDLQADSRLELARELHDIGRRILCEDLGGCGASGGVASGFTYTYTEDESWTHERYFDAIGRPRALPWGD